MKAFKHWINEASRFCLNRSLGLLLIRLAVALVFFMHGWSKVNNIPGVEGMMTGFGFPAGTGMFIAWLEVIGGLSMALGVLPRVFGVVFGIQMIVAYFLTGGFGSAYQRHELEIVLILLSFGIALTGSGKYSIMKMECDDCGGMLCDRGTSCPMKK
jgi:putative oxidoreductase